MERGDIILFAITVILWSSLVISCIHPVQTQPVDEERHDTRHSIPPFQEAQEYLSEDWLFTPPFNESTPAPEAQTPRGYWLYNVTIPYVNGTNNQWWSLVVHDDGLYEEEGHIRDLYSCTYQFRLNTTEMAPGWASLLLKADILPAWMQGSRWRFERWFYIEH